MKYVKCLKINKDSNTYILKDGDEKEFNVTKQQLQDAMKYNKISIVNIKDDLSDFDYESGCIAYNNLASSSISPKTEKAYKKSIVLGMSPEVIDYKGMKVCKAGNYEELCITDCTQLIGGDIKANKVTFIGEQSIDSYTKDLRYSIKCDKAIIFNKCVMSRTNWYSRGVNVVAKEIEVRHNFIDENTIFEMLSIFLSYKGYRGFIKTLDLMHVHFEAVNIDYNKLFENIEKMKQEKRKYAENKIEYIKNKIGSTSSIIHEVICELGSYVLLLESLYVSLPEYKDYFKDEAYKILDHMYKVLDTFKSDTSNNSTNAFQSILKQCNKVMLDISI